MNKSIFSAAAVLIAPLAAAALALAGPSALAQDEKDWIDVRDAKELRALYSNKTFKGKDWMDRAWTGYYRADGKGIMITESGRFQRTWQVQGDDQVCVTMAMSNVCYRFQRHRTKPATYRALDLTNVKAAEFTVEDGVPKF